MLSPKELERHLTDFCELYRSCFNDYIDENVVAKRFLENPYGDLFMGVAFDNGKLVANYSVSPTRLVVHGQLVKAALSLNTMTHPYYAGKGLFVTLANAVYGELVNNDYDVVYGFPNYLSNRTFCTKLGWRNIYEIPTLELNVAGVKLDYEKDAVCETKTWERLDPFAKSSDLVYVFKDWEYVEWRYLNNPTNAYRIVKTENGGWAVFKYYENIINIVELHVFRLEEINAIIGYLVDLALKAKKERVTVWSKINTQEHYQFEKLGFRNRYPITYFGARELKGCLEGIWDWKNWRIQMGDDNVY